MPQPAVAAGYGDGCHRLPTTPIRLRPLLLRAVYDTTTRPQLVCKQTIQQAILVSGS